MNKEREKLYVQFGNGREKYTKMKIKRKEYKKAI